MPETHPTPDPIPIRPRLRRQSPDLRELRTKKTGNPGSRDVLPRLLTRIQDMWLMDLREPQETNTHRPVPHSQSKKISKKQSITRPTVSSSFTLDTARPSQLTRQYYFLSRQRDETHNGMTAVRKNRFRVRELKGKRISVSKKKKRVLAGLASRHQIYMQLN
jgi:hypothetical protein